VVEEGGGEASAVANSGDVFVCTTVKDKEIE
jgi:hypothetical protein